MSRNDTHLSLCLEQASLSTLHYRHGCIIVRGINGRLRSAAASSNAVIACPKSKGSTKYHDLPSSGSDDACAGKNKPPKTYIAFNGQEQAIGTGAGALANTPLSMHSEMMAINSALSLSSAIACQGTARSTQWLQKPCFKLSGRSKRRNRLQQLKAYADAVCRASEEESTTSERRGGSYYYQNGYYDAEEEKEQEEKEEKDKEKRGSVSTAWNPGNNNVEHHAQVNHHAFHEANCQKARQLTSDNNEKHRKQYMYGLPD
ncbi:MAG: hypothetical protein Q9207_005275, partial [Kuettlingeria erythrocarpa]